jgi:hypothetical protein
VSGFGEGLGFCCGEVGELGLDSGDFSGEVGGIDAVEAGCDVVGLLWCEDPAGLKSLPGGLGWVVESFASPISDGGVPGGFTGRGEDVQPQGHQWSELVEEVEFTGGVVSLLGSVFTDHMIVF